MTIRRIRLRQMFFEIRRQAGNPPIPFVPWEVASRWREEKSKHTSGYCLYRSRVAVNPAQTIASAQNTIWHEIGHVLFPYKPHWWIYTYAVVMSRRDHNDNYISDKNAKWLTPSNIGWERRHFPIPFPQIPDRRELKRMTLAASNRAIAKKRIEQAQLQERMPI